MLPRFSNIQIICTRATDPISLYTFVYNFTITEKRSSKSNILFFYLTPVLLIERTNTGRTLDKDNNLKKNEI